MANRFANLDGTKKIKDEYTKINTGFDGVEQELDAHIAENVSNGGTAHGINLLAKKAQEDWITAVGQNSWVSDTNVPFRYFKDNFGIVWVQGQAKDGTVAPGTVVTTLPAGYRPTHTLRFFCIRVNDGTSHTCYINIAGEITVLSSSLTAGTIGFLFAFRAA